MGVRIVAAALLLAAASLQAQSQVTFDRILHADREPQNWLSYSGTPMNQRYSGLTQITPANVKNLQLQWIWQARSLEKFEATPLVIDGVMYTVEAPNNIVALDAASGRPFWTFNYTPAPEGRPCCGRVNRGVAILGDTLYMATIDAHLLAVDAKSGQKVWDLVVAKAADRYSIGLGIGLLGIAYAVCALIPGFAIRERMFDPMAVGAAAAATRSRAGALPLVPHAQEMPKT